MDIVDKMLPEDLLFEKNTQRFNIPARLYYITKYTGVNMHKKHVDIYCDVAQGSLRKVSPI